LWVTILLWYISEEYDITLDESGAKVNETVKVVKPQPEKQQKKQLPKAARIKGKGGPFERPLWLIPLHQNSKPLLTLLYILFLNTIQYHNFCHQISLHSGIKHLQFTLMSLLILKYLFSKTH